MKPRIAMRSWQKQRRRSTTAVVMLTCLAAILSGVVGAQSPPVPPAPQPASADASVFGSAAPNTESSAVKPADAAGATANGIGTPPSSGARGSTIRAFLALILGVALVLGLIIGLKINAFIALISAAMVVSIVAPGPVGQKISRVAEAFGATAGDIGIVIGLAAVIGKCMLDSGAADRIVRSFVRVLGADRAHWALMASGYVLAIPVFFDTVFYLLVPLARSMYRRTNKNYLLYLMAISAGGAITHSLVPPTPGPLLMASTLNVDLGVMILVGMAVAVPGAIVGVWFAMAVNRRMPIAMRTLGGEPEPEPLPEDQLPSLWLSLAPIVLPVALISVNSILRTMVGQSPAEGLPANEAWSWWVARSDLIGDANFALLISTVIALSTVARTRGFSRREATQLVETALMNGGVIILIVCAGGAFGSMLQAAQIGPAIESLFRFEASGGRLAYLLLGFAIAFVLKFAQGSGTVSMIVGSSMMAAIVSPEQLGCHMAYLAMAIGAGSMTGSWMNDAGFWIFARMGGLTEEETFKSWTTLLVVCGLACLMVTLAMAHLMPLT